MNFFWNFFLPEMATIYVPNENQTYMIHTGENENGWVFGVKAYFVKNENEWS